MRNISSKTDNVGDVLPASDFNINHRIELQSIVTDSGFSLDPEGGPDTDTDMFGKSLTVYANASQYYADTGAADAYEIDRVGNLQPLEQLLDGTIVYFKAANTNTGASTLDVDGIGVKDLVDNAGAALTGNEIIAGQYVSARYNSSTDDFELIDSKRSALRTWENVGDDFVPVVSGTGTLGSITELVEAAYFGDSNYAYFGNDQDMYLGHTGVLGHLNNSTGDLLIANLSANSIILKTSDVQRWLFNSAGHLVPNVASTYDIGSTSLEIRHLYHADNGQTYYGNDQDFSVYFDGTWLEFKNNGGGGWAISGSTNTLFPLTGPTNLGTSGGGINNFYQGTGGYHYFGDSQQFYIYKSASFNWGVIETTDHDIIINAQGVTRGIQFDAGSGGSFSMKSNAFQATVGSTYDIGNTGAGRFDTVYCVTLDESSDEKNKEDVGSPLGLDFILNLSPKSYRMKIGKNKKRKQGLIAQEVIAAIEEMGMASDDFGGVSYDAENDEYGMSYSNFIGPIIQAIKELSEKIDNLQKIEPDNK